MPASSSTVRTEEHKHHASTAGEGTATGTSATGSADPESEEGDSEPGEPDPDVAAGDLPDVGMDGVNDPADPDPSVGPPVLLVHGTFSTASSNFGNVAPALIADGRCVYAIDYGQEGSAPVDASAADVAAFAQGVLALTGTEQLDVVGYSQGGLCCAPRCGSTVWPTRSGWPRSSPPPSTARTRHW